MIRAWFEVGLAFLGRLLARKTGRRPPLFGRTAPTPPPGTRRKRRPGKRAFPAVTLAFLLAGSGCAGVDPGVLWDLCESTYPCEECNKVVEDAPPDDPGWEESITGPPTLPVPDLEDDLDPAVVTWLHGGGEVASWKIDGELYPPTVRGREVTLPYDRAGEWPILKGTKNIVGNPWVFVKIGGAWYGATWEWLRKGVISKKVEGEFAEIGLQTKVRPIRSWVPARGELACWMVSTPARGAGRTINRRTPIRCSPLP